MKLREIKFIAKYTLYGLSLYVFWFMILTTLLSLITFNEKIY